MPGESGASQVGLAQGRDALGGHGAGKPLEATVRGAARRQGYLLLQDDLHQRPEPRRTIPQWRRPVARDDGRKVPIPPRELGDALGQAVGGQLKRHVHLTVDAIGL